MPFATASDLVVEHLKQEVPMGFWSVTQHTDDRQVYLSVRDDAYGLRAGDSHAWSDSFCQYTVKGTTPQIAPDAMAVPEFASAGVSRDLRIGAYVGVPIQDGDGRLFGTLCGLDPRVQPDGLVRHAGLLDLCVALLSQTLQAERVRAGPARAAHVRTGDIQHVRAAERGAPPGPPAEDDAWLQLRGPLRRAIETGRIDAYYQPVIDIVGGRVVGFEALARWWHGGRMIGPDVFVPIAARDGLMPALTDHMLDLAAAQLARWAPLPTHRHLRVGVNVSPTCMTDPTLPERVSACLGRHRVEGSGLMIEITEDALAHDLPAAADVARRLHRTGIALALDDFGTGYSSLAHLHMIPLQSMKIDRSFVRDIDTDPRAEQFLRALLSFGRDLGLEVVTEGIERVGQATVVARNGGRLAQGYLFGPPARLQP